MKKTIIKKAARLYVLSIAAQLDEGDSMGDTQRQVIEWASSDARQKLEKMGIDYGGIATLDACIQRVQAEAADNAMTKESK
ncbi:hypothetical protein [Rubellicoccus peritrichatus]|uniref:Uncharacterized protein n=2 Tax=Rubellicoccus peritrichatus TaxID=3080537 RepID=A0AAQ3QUX5_9BACT|nr:hypothetical protein [Puniceicoccus sp. CR14]WOO40395.1 hypothetical protein RZN69_17385 [Puniceicoccus sp. CR14]WOO40444.1 hypothetical protein RZN69_17630 [Puniceicoccus sp. CR14]WOO40493.1 hypothetical protein RZN69_17875 [Puniceicoccus sp. CR14]